MQVSTSFRTFLTVLIALPLLADVASVRDLIRNGRVAEAIAECDRELKATPKSVAFLTLKGLAQRATGDSVSALASLRQAVAIQPNAEAALLAVAQIEFETRDANAVKTLAFILRQRPASETAHAMMAELLYELRSCDAAIPHFEKLPVASYTPGLRWQYGVCLLSGERWADAAAQFAALMQLREHEPTRYNLGLALWNAKRYPAAVEVLTPLDHPGAAADALRLLASALESAGQTPKALDVLQRAIGQHPGEERLLIDLAVLCMEHKSIHLGVEVVRAGLLRSPGSARLHTLLGVLLVRGGEFENGQEELRLAGRLAPGNGLAHIGIASTLMQMGLASDAVKVLKEQLAQSGQNPNVEVTLARALLLKSPSVAELREAAALLNRVIKKEPTNAAAYGLLGKAYFQLGDMPGSSAALATAIRLDPEHRTAIYQLMLVHQRAGNTAQAAALARRVRELMEKEKADEETSLSFRAVHDRNQGHGSAK